MKRQATTGRKCTCNSYIQWKNNNHNIKISQLSKKRILHPNGQETWSKTSKYMLPFIVDSWIISISKQKVYQGLWITESLYCTVEINIIL